MEVIGYILAVFIGIVLGLFGSGGAIISFPVLVYFMGISPELAGNYTLLIVGISALVGTIKQLKEKTLDIKVAISFSIPLLLSFFITKKIILPAIPSKILETNALTFTKDNLIMSLFVITLSVIIYKMLNKDSNEQSSHTTSIQSTFNLKYLIQSFLVGFLSASIGAGGGFIIVPALMSIYKLPIKNATSTSLFVITINAFIGTLLNIHHFQSEHITMIVVFTILSIIGIFIGIYLNKIANVLTLKKSYAYFLIIILFSTISTEIYKFIQNQ
ncbi:MAG TPA: sulfite exporter TauE/SafE family protein [Bacteroidia bacterium]|nr:sulfite exporter TauE/SafE family protein [Bacteroidia bacterium]